MRTLLPLVLLAGLALACGGGGGAAGKAEAKPVARIGQDVITQGELDHWIKDQLFERETDHGDPAKLYELRSHSLDNMISQRLLDREAKSRGVTTDKLLDEEASKRVKVTEQEVEDFYNRNKEHIGGDLDKLRPRIRQYMERRAGADAARAFVAELRKNAGVEVLLKTPRVDVAAVGPSIGPKDAPVTIIEFSDFQCPFCKRVEPTVEQLLKKYKGRVRFVYRHFPLDQLHPLARGAAEAAICAQEQGHFWDYHARLFAQPKGLEPASLDQYAADAGLDMKAFKACRAQGREDQLERDVKAGEAAGVTGTPAFFVNGIPLKGAQPIQEFERVIDSELAAAKPTPAASPDAAAKPSPAAPPDAAAKPSPAAG